MRRTGRRFPGAVDLEAVARKLPLPRRWRAECAEGLTPPSMSGAPSRCRHPTLERTVEGRRRCVPVERERSFYLELLLRARDARKVPSSSSGAAPMISLESKARAGRAWNLGSTDNADFPSRRSAHVVAVAGSELSRLKVMWPRWRRPPA